MRSLQDRHTAYYMLRYEKFIINKFVNNSKDNRGANRWIIIILY